MSTAIVLLAGDVALREKMSGAPPYGEAESEIPELDPYAWMRDWKRPDGPARVGLQVGHWKNNELPEELSKLIGNTGSSGGGKSEAEVNLAIADAARDVLMEEGIAVDIIPATVPVNYWADVFVAIHADGSTDRSVSGFKVAAPWRDFTKRAENLVSHLENEYGKETDLVKDPNISRNMRGYYAFSWWRYDHAIHPMTTAAIIETGFLTNANDRKLIVNNPKRVGRAIAQGILGFLGDEKLL